MAQSLITKSISLTVINNALEYDKTRTLHGDCLFSLVQSVYPKGLPSNTYLYWQQWDSECDVTPQTESDIEAINKLTGAFYLVTYPAGPETWIPILISAAISVAAAFLMPMPVMPNGAASQPPSPNNALAQRTNRQRLGGRVPDIYGTIWALPDLLTQTYSVYIDHEEVEYSYMCLGRGYYEALKAYDDTTPINQVRGATALVFNPNTTLDDSPSAQFGNNFTSDEVALSRFATKRYTSVNGQTLAPSDGYIISDIAFKNPNIIETSETSVDFTSLLVANSKISIDSASDLASGNNVTDASGNVVTYNLSGLYTVISVTKSQIILDNPQSVNTDWEKLIDNVDFANGKDVVLSVSNQTLWQGWFYTDLTDHTDVIINIKAPNGLYWTRANGSWEPSAIEYELESEIVDSSSIPIFGTLETRKDWIYARSYSKYSSAENIYSGIKMGGIESYDDDVRRTAAVSIFINNSHFSKGKRLRWRIRRVSGNHKTSDGFATNEIKISDFYGIRPLEPSDIPSDVTTVYAKTKATEGALSIKERKLRLLVQRYLRDWQNNDALILSNRIDDIVYNIATDPIIGSLSITDLNMAQIKAEIDAQIAHFGTPLCAEYSGTFDNTDVTTEEMLQTVAQAGFCQAYRINNQIHLNFEKPTDYPIVQFNAHNIAPDSYEMAESFGSRNNYDGVQVTYIDPTDDARVTLDYPSDKSATNPQKVELVGVRNKTQAHMHMMRNHWKNQLAYKSCELVGLDESGIVIPTNRIDVADIYNSDVQQGIVVAQTVDGSGNTLLSLSEPVVLTDGQQATIFVQTVAGIVDNIACVIGADSYTVVLSRPPVQALSLSYDAVVQATYRLVTHGDFDRDSYIVTAKEPSDNPLSHRLTCINYDDRYYQNDTDYKNGLIS